MTETFGNKVKKGETAGEHFYAHVSKDWGHIVLLLFVCPSVCPFVHPSVCLHKLNMKT